MQLKLRRGEGVDSKFCSYENVLSTGDSALNRIRPNTASTCAIHNSCQAYGRLVDPFSSAADPAAKNQNVTPVSRFCAETWGKRCWVATAYIEYQVRHFDFNFQVTQDLPCKSEGVSAPPPSRSLHVVFSP